MALAGLNEAIPRRAILGVMMFLACMFSYVIRTNLSIIIVAMTNPAAKNDSTGPVCSAKGGNETIPLQDYGPRFADWTGPIQGYLLGAYFYGGIPGSIPAGLLAEKYGGAKVVTFATLIPAVLNLAVPLLADIHYSIVFILRLLMGFFGAAVYPALHAMIARWVPPSEKGLFVWTMQGGPFGMVVTYTLCGQVISVWGWKAAYYTTSGLMLIFLGFWVYLIYDTPDHHPTIAAKEKAYIKEQIGTTVSKQKVKLPVVSVFTSVPFLVLLWSHFANMWGIYLLAIVGPKYTLSVLGFPMKSGGFLTGLPNMTRLGAGILFAAAGDYLRRKKILSLGWIRRLFMMPSHMGPAIFLILMTYAECDTTLALISLIMSQTLNGAACQTNLVNHQDLSPNFAGSLYGIMNTFGSIPGIVIPMIVGFLTKHRNGIEEWRPLFWLSALVFTSATILFWLLGSTEVQSWNDAGKIAPATNVDEEKQMNTVPPKDTQTEDEEEENGRL